MTTTWIIWLGLGGLNVVVWTLRVVAMVIGMRRRLVLSAHTHDGPPSPAPRLSVLVAAKDEERSIETCVRTLLDQDYPDFEMVAIDDRSTDQTRAILQRLATESGGKLRVATVDSLPDGWFGKNYAMHRGVQQATGEWLCFTDADCRFTSRHALTAAVREASASGADFFCLTPILETPTAWERIVQPVCSMVLMLWFLPHRVNDPKRTTAYANGAFMLLKRSAYDAIGGHRAVWNAVNEDIHLARRAKRAGLRLRVMENDGLYVTRMYRNFSEMHRGWGRIFRGSLETVPRLATAATLTMLFTLLPWVSLMTAVAGRLTCAPASPWSWNLALAIWLGPVIMLQGLMWQWYRILRIPPRWSLGYVIGAAVVTELLMRTLCQVVLARRIRWRDTEYPPTTSRSRAASSD